MASSSSAVVLIVGSQFCSRTPQPAEISSSTITYSLLPIPIRNPASCTSFSSNLNLNLNHVCRAGTAQFAEEEDDSKFVPLNADDPQFGPPVLLLLGFDIQETPKIQELLKNLEGEFLKIIHCTEDMICRSLWEAVHAQQPNLEKAKIAKSLPRICFLSGLTGEEMMMFIDAFPETGLEAAVFAAVVPNSANKSLQELIDEVMGDHEMMTARELGSAA